MRTIAFFNSKGGCGKTTGSINLAACLAAIGEQTLLLDLDAQGHCGLALGLKPGAHGGVADLLDGGMAQARSLAEVTCRVSDRLDLVSSDGRLNLLRHRSGFHFTRLADALDTARRQYGWCILDCSTSPDALTRAALELADEILVPVETSCLGLLSLPSLVLSLGLMKDRRGQAVRYRLLPTMYDPRTRAAREALAELRSRFPAHLASCAIRMDTRLAEAAGAGQPIAVYDPASRGAHDYLSLTRSLLGGRTIALPASSASSAARADELALRARQLAALQCRHLPSSSGSPSRTTTLADRLQSIYGVQQLGRQVQFAAAFPGAQEVQLAGDFNGWTPEPLAADGEGAWHRQLELSPGRYRYRYIVDGQWTGDPYNPHTEPNEFGEANHVVEVSELLSHAA